MSYEVMSGFLRPNAMKILVLSHDGSFRTPSDQRMHPRMREALIALAAGEAHQPLRTIIRPPDAKGVMGLMPSYVSGDSLLPLG